MTETELQTAIVTLARYCGYRTMHVRRSIARGQRWATTTSVAGWPDLIIWKPGRIIAAELKTDNGAPTPAQLDVLASLEAAGVEVHLWRPADLDQIAATLNRKATPHGPHRQTPSIATPR
jgi:hypothetical protein